MPGACAVGLIAFDDAQIGAPIDEDRTGRNRARHLEVHGLGERRHADDRAGDDGDAAQILEDPLGADRRRRRSADAREPDRHRGAVLDARDRHELLEAGAAVAAHGAVDLDRPRFRGRLELGARHRDQPPRDLEHVARPRANPDEIGRGEAGHGTADVVDAGFGHAQRDVRRRTALRLRSSEAQG